MRIDRYKAGPSLLRCHLSHKRQRPSQHHFCCPSMNACEFSLTSIEATIGATSDAAAMGSGGFGALWSLVSLSLFVCDRVFMDIKSME